MQAGESDESPAGTGVIADIQRGKCAISRTRKSTRSDEPPRVEYLAAARKLLFLRARNALLDLVKSVAPGIGREDNET